MPALLRNILLLAMCLTTLSILPLPTLPLRAEDMISVSDPHVQARVEGMRDASKALNRLNQMIAGRHRFDPRSARQDRKILIAAMGNIPRRFQRYKYDTATRAKPRIWSNWNDFRARARAARASARSLNANSLNRLRQTAPAVVRTCLDCHQRYRRPP
ncbi:cytochrome c [Primorskyibacter sp. S87]|uniref:cytochrome c n=1 Tax=Primorskyibacter sp. S87 TaxID=3415126 RepID=UPI003C7B603B